MQALTERQAEVFYFIRDTHRETGKGPTFAEMRNQFGFGSNNAVQDHIKALIRKGAIDNNGRKRGISPSKGFRVKIKES